jgi:cytochrome P450
VKSFEIKIHGTLTVVASINNNAHYICFWMLGHMLCAPELFYAVRDETDACFTVDGSCNVDRLLTQCSNLDATWNEALRMYNASTAVRKATTDCIIGGKMIHRGDQIFGPVRNWQLDSQYFGRNAAEFDTKRWSKGKDMTRSKGFTPFGGGHTYCPGRYFAQRETYLFIAFFLQRFEVVVTDKVGNSVKSPKVSPVDISFPAPAAMRPVHDMYVTLTLRNPQK